MVEWETAEREQREGRGRKRQRLDKRIWFGEGSESKQQLLPWSRVGRSSHNYAVFNCSAHAPTMNIALPHYRAPCVSPHWVLGRAALRQPCAAWPLWWGGRPRSGRAAHRPEQLSHHVRARLIDRGREAFLTSSSSKKRRFACIYTVLVII